jgi:foldase protein PrsA
LELGAADISLESKLGGDFLMGEGTQSTPSTAGRTASEARPAAGKSKWLLVVAGTAGALLVAGILFQVFRPAAGQAQEKAQVVPNGRAAGSATLSDGKAGGTKRYVAKVDNELVDYDEVANECFLRVGREVLENIISRKIIEHACQQQDIHISEAEVDQEIVGIAKKFGQASVDEWYRIIEAERHITAAQYRRDIIWPMLALKKLAGSEVKITKQDMSDGFQRNYGKRVKVRIIVLDNPRRAAECWEKTQKHPEDFEKLVREYSIDSSSRPLGGAVPPIRNHSGNKESEELEKVAFRLKEGEVSPVVQVMQQYIIMICDGWTSPIVEDPKVVEHELYEDLKEEKVQKMVAEVFAKIREEARVDNYLTRETTGGKKKPAEAGAPAIKQTGGTAARPRSATTARKPAAGSPR